MHLRPEIDLYKSVLTGYCGTETEDSYLGHFKRTAYGSHARTALYEDASSLPLCNRPGKGKSKSCAGGLAGGLAAVKALENVAFKKSFVPFRRF